MRFMAWVESPKSVNNGECHHFLELLTISTPQAFYVLKELLSLVTPSGKVWHWMICSIQLCKTRGSLSSLGNEFSH